VKVFNRRILNNSTPPTSKLYQIFVYHPLLLLFSARPITRVIIIRQFPQFSDSSGVDYRVSMDKCQCSQKQAVRTIKLATLWNTKKCCDQIVSTPEFLESVLSPQADWGFSSTVCGSYYFRRNKTWLKHKRKETYKHTITRKIMLHMEFIWRH
jgi:hypothetical protein